MLTEDQWGVVNYLCELKSFEFMWANIDGYYQNMFHDDISDEQRIDEYKYIVQQLNKYISKRKEELIKLDSMEDMAGQVIVWLGESSQYGGSRKELVYNFLRDAWLREVLSALSTMLEQVEEQDEEWEDE